MRQCTHRHTVSFWLVLMSQACPCEALGLALDARKSEQARSCPHVLSFSWISWTALRTLLMTYLYPAKLSVSARPCRMQSTSWPHAASSADRKRKAVLRRHEYSLPSPGAFSTPLYSCPTPSPCSLSAPPGAARRSCEPATWELVPGLATTSGSCFTPTATFDSAAGARASSGAFDALEDAHGCAP